MDKLLFFILCQFGLSFFTYCQNQPSKDKDPYNLEFRFQKGSDPWIKRFPTVFGIDTLRRVEGKPSLFISKPAFRWLDIADKFMFFRTPHRQFPFVFSFYQQIPLPDSGKSSEILLAVTSQSRDMLRARLGVAGFDASERMVYADSIDLTHEGGWQTDRLVFDGKGLKFLRIGIYGEGDGADTTERSILWLDRIRLSVGGSDIGEYPVPNDTCVDNRARLDANSLIPLSHDDPRTLTNVASYQDPHVLVFGFGESLHGGEEIATTAYEQIRYLVEHRDCKAVLFEKGPDICLKWDLYVRGIGPDTTINQIREDARRYKISLQGTCDFLVWLREYNRTRQRKVRVRGIDRTATAMSFLFDCLALLQPDRKDVAFRALMKAVDAGEYAAVRRLLEADKLLRAALGGKELAYWIDVVKLEELGVAYYNDTVNGGDYVLKYSERRDFLMAERTKWSVANDLLPGETAAIYAHSGHVQKLPLQDSRVPQIPNNSLGAYLTEQYGSGYAAFSIQVGEGAFQESTSYGGEQANGKLVPPPPNTFEFVARETGLDYFFCKTSDVPQAISYYRHIPNNNYRTQFKFGALRENHDGLIFIRATRSIENGVANGRAESNKLDRKRQEQRAEFLKRLEEANKK